jgi:hypothetical protein
LDTLKKAFTAAGGIGHLHHLGQNTFTLGRSDYQRQYEPILHGWEEGRSALLVGARDQVTSGVQPPVNDLHPDEAGGLRAPSRTAAEQGDGAGPIWRLRLHADQVREDPAAARLVNWTPDDARR